MRITPFIIFDQLNQSLNKTLDTYSMLNEELSTNKKILAPSDDPNGLTRAMDYNVRISNNGQYTQNIDLASTGLKYTSSVLQSASSTLSQVVSLVSRISGSSVDPLTQNADALTVASLRDTLRDLGNTKLLDQYIFSGNKTDTPAYATGTYNYQGDAGVQSIAIDKGTSLPVTIPGSNAFSYTIGAAGATYVKQINGNLNAHYTQGAGTTINVEVRDAADTTVLDTFSFSNAIQMTDILSSAISGGNTTRIAALSDPFARMQTQVNTATSDVGSRVARLSDQSTWLNQSTNSLKTALSSIEDANMVEVIAQLKQTEITLAAIRDSAGRVLSQSLLDFLK